MGIIMLLGILYIILAVLSVVMYKKGYKGITGGILVIMALGLLILIYMGLHSPM